MHIVACLQAPVGGQLLGRMFNVFGVGRFLFTSLQTRDFPPFAGAMLSLPP